MDMKVKEIFEHEVIRIDFNGFCFDLEYNVFDETFLINSVPGVNGPDCNIPVLYHLFTRFNREKLVKEVVNNNYLNPDTVTEEDVQKLAKDWLLFYDDEFYNFLDLNITDKNKFRLVKWILECKAW